MSHTDTPSPAPIPDEVLAAFPPEDSSALEEIWDLADGYYGLEPEFAWYRRTGSQIWQNLQPAIAPRRPNRLLRLVTSPWKATRPVYRYATAACIAVLLAVGIVTSDRGATIEALPSEQLVHELPDGSTVHLNSGTRLTYTKNFGNSSRDVRLNRGEVLFEVTEGDVPFRVQTFNGMVTVLGTAFNVRAWPHGHSPATDVTVREGTVQLASHMKPDDGFILSAGQAATLSQGTAAPVAVERPSVENAISWTSRSFKYADHSIGTIFEELERRYDVDINVASDNLLDKRIGVLIESPANEEEIIHAICELNCSYRSVPGGYEITDPTVE